MRDGIRGMHHHQPAGNGFCFLSSLYDDDDVMTIITYNKDISLSLYLFYLVNIAESLTKII